MPTNERDEMTDPIYDFEANQGLDVAYECDIYPDSYVDADDLSLDMGADYYDASPDPDPEPDPDCSSTEYSDCQRGDCDVPDMDGGEVPQQCPEVCDWTDPSVHGDSADAPGRSDRAPDRPAKLFTHKRRSRKR